MSIDLSSFVDFLRNPTLLSLFLLCAFTLKIALLVILNKQHLNSKIITRGTAFLSTMLVFSAIVDFLTISKILLIPNVFPIYGSHIIIVKRFHWAANVFSHLFLSIFVESLLGQNIKISLIYRAFRLIFGVCLAAAFIITIPSALDAQTSWGPLLRATAYLFNLVIGCYTILKVLRATTYSTFPKILKRQINIFILAFMGPHLFIKCLTYNPFTDGHFLNTYLFNDFAIIFATAAMYYCTFRLMGLRFLNTREQITTSRTFNFVSLMKEVLVQLNSIANSTEFRYVTQQVFSRAFQLPNGSVRLIIIQDENYTVSDEQMRLLQTELALDRPLGQLVMRTKVITRDEIDFSAYYDQDAAYAQAAEFLRKLDADVFVPVYDRSTLLGCIIINEGARPKKFYSGGEQDEMAVFATSLSSIITLVKNRNIDVLLARKNSLETELYHRHRELGQYQESIRSFLRHAHEHKIGILYYKYNTFTFGNQTAHEFVTCDLNQQRGHPLVIELRKIAQNTEKYGTPQNTTICIDSEQRLAVSSFPSLERQSTIIVLAHPDISDVIKMQSDLLRDPGHWNYLLYLETTEAGRLIRELVPGVSKTLLNFKIDLLRAALSHRAILLNARAEDRQPLADLLQATSQRQQIQTITLKEPEKNLAVAHQLFGFAKILGTSQEQVPLLERFDKTGTIHLENIHFLSRETQLHLAEFLRYGAFTAIKDDQRVPADVRIICSSTESLHTLVEQGGFLPELLDELRHHILVLPQPGMLDRNEFDELITECMQQLLKNHPLKKILFLSEREINLLYTEKCASLIELKRRLNTLIANKVAKNEQRAPAELIPAIPTELDGGTLPAAGKKIPVDSTKNSGSPTALDSRAIASDELINQAILLGKKALKDRELMIHLWNTFQNQARIATLLGVNRSSVNRRYKHFNIS